MDRREHLEAAFDKLADEPEKEEVTAKVEPQEIEEKVPEVKAEDSAKDEPVVAEAPKKPEEERKDPDAYKSAGKAQEGQITEGKAPLSWKPAAKEHWAKLPPEIRSEISRRETEMQRFVSQNDHHRRFSESFAKVVQPFQHLIQAQNSTPLQSVRNLMTTTAMLMTGTQQQKAEIVREIIGNYNVDIGLLDQMLAGQAPQQRNDNSLPPALHNALQPVYGFMNEIKQAREASEQRKMEQAQREIDESADLPFFDDLREDIADIMEISAKRNIEVNIKQAYEKALALRPDISEILTKRKAAEDAKKFGTRQPRSRRVASTLTGAPAGPAGNGKIPQNRREQLEAAWDERAGEL